MLAALLAVGLNAIVAPPDRKLTQDDIDAAVVHTLKKRPRDPSDASKAYDVIRPSVVLVRRLGEDKKSKAASKDDADAGGRGEGRRRAVTAAETVPRTPGSSR